MQPTTYTAPTIQVAGDAREIVLGLGYVGSDIRGEYMTGRPDFLSDEGLDIA